MMQYSVWGSLVVGLMSLAAQAWAQSYTLRDLGPVVPAQFNAIGTVVGQDSAHQQVAVVVDLSGAVTPLGFLPFPVSPGVCGPCQQHSQGHGIAGPWVVGSAAAGQNGAGNHAFVWTQATGMLDLTPDIGVNVGSAANAVNIVGTIAGYTGTPTQTTGAVVWIGGQRTLLPSLGSWAIATAMNDAGEIVGEAALPDGRTHAVRWPVEGGIADIDTVNGATSFATVITSLGGIGGEVTVPGVGRRGFVWTAATGMILQAPLPGDTISTVQGYNAASQIVGFSARLDESALSTVEHAVSWDGGLAQPLADQVTLPPGFVLLAARGVNDAGVVLALAVTNAPPLPPAFGDRHAVLLEPRAPVPALDFVQVVTGDFDGDGHPDAAGITRDQAIWIQMAGHAWQQIPGWGTQLAVGDFTDDGRDDLVLLGGGGTIWIRQDGATWQQLPGLLSTLIAGDFTGTGTMQLAGLTSNQYIWWAPQLGNWIQLPGMLTTLETVPQGAGQPDAMQGVAYNGTTWLAKALGQWVQILPATQVAQR